MSTINDKLQYLDETKNVIKTSIKNKGVAVEDTDTFRSYAEKIDNIPTTFDDFLVDNYPSNLFKANMIFKKLPTFDMTKITNMANAFQNWNQLQELPELDTSKVTNMSYMCAYCSAILTFPNYDTSKVTDMSYMLSNCANIKKLPLLNCSSVINLNSIFNFVTTLVDVGGFKDLGKAYTQQTQNYSNYTLSLYACNNLTHDSVMNIINNLYDLNLTYDVENGGTLYRQKLDLPTTVIALLTDEEKAIATNKGWDIV